MSPTCRLFHLSGSGMRYVDGICSPCDRLPHTHSRCSHNTLSPHVHSCHTSLIMIIPARRKSLVSVQGCYKTNVLFYFMGILNFRLYCILNQWLHQQTQDFSMRRNTAQATTTTNQSTAKANGNRQMESSWHHT